MYERRMITVQREVPAIQIPDGVSVIIPHGSQVMVTQQLGGSLTVMTDRGAMFRIDEKDVDALGFETPSVDEGEAASGPLEQRVWDQMRKCYDPEIPVNIVDLGLIYDCRIEQDEGSGAAVAIKMTLTAPGCGMGPVLAADVKSKVESLPDVDSAEVEIVLDPPWNMDMMTEAARLQLGLM